MEVGVAAEIECIIEKGYLQPAIKWTKKGHTENVLSTGPSLMFDNPTEEDEAVYCVEVQNFSLSLDLTQTADKEEKFEFEFEKMFERSKFPDK